MPNNQRNTHSEATPHFDGKRESIINDPTGKQMGVRVDTGVKQNPFHVTELKNEEMDDFKRVMKTDS